MMMMIRGIKSSLVKLILPIYFDNKYIFIMFRLAL